MPAPSNLLKFRPVLTLAQITYLLDRVAYKGSTLPLSEEMEASIRRVLVPLIAKIEVGAINPAYKLSETHALKQAESSQRTRYENGEMSAQEEADYEAKILGV